MEDWLAVGGSLFESFMSWLEGPSLEIPTATATRKEQQHVGIQQELVHIGHSTAVYRVAHIPGRRPTSAEADARKRRYYTPGSNRTPLQQATVLQRPRQCYQLASTEGCRRRAKEEISAGMDGLVPPLAMEYQRKPSCGN